MNVLYITNEYFLKSLVNWNFLSSCWAIQRYAGIDIASLNKITPKINVLISIYVLLCGIMKVSMKKSNSDLKDVHYIVYMYQYISYNANKLNRQSTVDVTGIIIRSKRYMSTLSHGHSWILSSRKRRQYDIIWKLNLTRI